MRTVVKTLSGQFTAGLSHSVCRTQREAEKCRLSRTIMIFGNGMVVGREEPVWSDDCVPCKS